MMRTRIDNTQHISYVLMYDDMMHIIIIYEIGSYYGTSQSQWMHIVTHFNNEFSTIRIPVYAI